MWRRISMAVASVALAVLLVDGRFASGEAGTTAPHNEGLIGGDSGNCVYYVRRPEVAFAIYLAGDWGCSTRSSHNTATNAWQTDVTLTCKGRANVTLEGRSTDPKQLLVNGVPFDLSSGSLLRVTAQGEIEQLPFAPLREIDRPYVKRLGAYFARRGS